MELSLHSSVPCSVFTLNNNCIKPLSHQAIYTLNRSISWLYLSISVNIFILCPIIILTSHTILTFQNIFLRGQSISNLKYLSAYACSYYEF